MSAKARATADINSATLSQADSVWRDSSSLKIMAARLGSLSASKALRAWGARARRAAWPYAAAQAKAVSASTPRRPQAVSRQSGEGAPAASIRVRTADTTRPVTGRS